MNSQSLEEKYHDAILVGKLLFDRGKTAGSSANMSFCHEGNIYITGSNTCFGTLKKQDFALINQQGETINDVLPSKELALHLQLLNAKNELQAVIHTHSFYSVLYSCLSFQDMADVLPSYTPYLKMKVGTIGMIPYAPPGSEALFESFRNRIADSDGYLLQHHGAVIAGKSILEAFYGIEELEESARIAWTLKNENISPLP